MRNGVTIVAVAPTSAEAQQEVARLTERGSDMPLDRRTDDPDGRRLAHSRNEIAQNRLGMNGRSAEVPFGRGWLQPRPAFFCRTACR